MLGKGVNETRSSADKGVERDEDRREAYGEMEARSHQVQDVRVPGVVIARDSAYWALSIYTAKHQSLSSTVSAPDLTWVIFHLLCLRHCHHPHRRAVASECDSTSA